MAAIVTNPPGSGGGGGPITGPGAFIIRDSAPVNGTQTLILELPFAVTVNSIITVTTSGSVDVSILGGATGATAVTFAAVVTADNTVTEVAATATNTWAVNDIIKITYTSALTPVDAIIQINYTR